MEAPLRAALLAFLLFRMDVGKKAKAAWANPATVTKGRDTIQVRRPPFDRMLGATGASGRPHLHAWG